MYNIARFIDYVTRYSVANMSDLNGAVYLVIIVAVIFHLRQIRVADAIDHKPEQKILKKQSFTMDMTQYSPLLGTITGDEPPFCNIDEKPSDVQDIDTKFFVRDQDGSHQISYNNEATIEKLRNYDQLFVVIHGFMMNGGDFDQMAERLLQVTHYNGRHVLSPGVVVVDWEGGASGFNKVTSCFFDLTCYYDTPAANVGVVGREVAAVVYLLVEYGKVHPNNIYMIGFSLGAQVCHYAALHYQKLSDITKPEIGRITALDAAGLNFEQEGSFVTKDDAIFVDVIHTSAGTGQPALDIPAGRYGTRKVSGHVDIVVNPEAEVQPQCSKWTSIFGCSHSFAHMLWTHSLLAPNSEDYVTRACDSSSGVTSALGLTAVDHEGRGLHCLEFDAEIDGHYDVLRNMQRRFVSKVAHALIAQHLH